VQDLAKGWLCTELQLNALEVPQKLWKTQWDCRILQYFLQ
jgi:hypothetical protein